jgi:predicted ATPase
MASLLCSLASPNCPIVSPKTPLQNADSGTILLLQQLVQLKIDSGLLLVVSETASPMPDGGEGYATCDKLSALCSWTLASMTVNPLDVEGVTNLVQQIAHIPANECGAFALSLHNRTGGNPHKIVQLLRLMYENCALHFDMHAGRWTVEEDGLDNLSVHDGDDAAIQASISTLSSDAKHMLGVCGCIGLTATLPMIATVAQRSIDDVYTALQPAMHKSLVVFDNRQDASGSTHLSDAVTLVTGKKRRHLPVSTMSPMSTATPTSSSEPPSFLLSDLSLRFLHEDIRIACLKLLPPDAVASCNYGVAKWKAASITDEDSLKEHLFMLMTRLQQCDVYAVPEEREWKWQYGQLFLEAASRARIASNFQEALQFARSGLKFAGECSVCSPRPH